MAEYIKRETAVKAANEWVSEACMAPVMRVSRLLDKLQKVPAADVAPVVHGHSVDVGGGLRQMLSMRRSTASLCQLLPQLRGDNGR